MPSPGGGRGWEVLWGGRIFLLGCVNLMRSDFDHLNLLYIYNSTARHGVTRKGSTKRLKHTGNLFRKNLQLKDIC